MDAEACKNIKISVQHLYNSFDKLEVIRDVSLDVYEGEVVCIIGPSGGGKSTFLRCLNRLEEYTGGADELGNYDTLGTINNKGSAVGHPRIVAKEDILLFFGAFDLVF